MLFAPGATVMAFSASSDTEMKAAPVLLFGSITRCIQTPAFDNESSIGSANQSSPNASNISVVAPPARALLSSHFANALRFFFVARLGPDAVATAIREQYFPRFAGDAIPSGVAGRFRSADTVS